MAKELSDGFRHPADVAKRMNSGSSTNIGLLKSTQAYLGSVGQGVHPDLVLEKAWEQFHKYYSPVIERFALASQVPTSDLYDCVQEVWAEVVVQLCDFRYDPSRCKLRSWLFRLVRAKAIDLIRRRTRHPTESLDLAFDTGREPVGDSTDPATEMERKWKGEMVRVVLDKVRKLVPERSFRVFYMRKIEEKSVEEVAASMALSREQVRTLQHRVQQKFQALFVEAYP